MKRKRELGHNRVMVFIRKTKGTSNTNECYIFSIKKDHGCSYGNLIKDIMLLSYI